MNVQTKQKSQCKIIVDFIFNLAFTKKLFCHCLDASDAAPEAEQHYHFLQICVSFYQTCCFTQLTRFTHKKLDTVSPCNDSQKVVSTQFLIGS